MAAPSYSSSIPFWTPFLEAIASPVLHFWLGSAFLVSVPVFFQAPLVRYAPWVSLVLTLGWLGISLHLISEPLSRRWGSLLYGFTLTWWTGSLYWGWLRTDPLWHLPIEALVLPIAFWGLRRGFAKIGNFFALGSLLGTALTDLYIHSVKLLPEWRQVMQTESIQDLSPVLSSALTKMSSLWGMAWGLETGLVLTVVGAWSLWRGQMGSQSFRLPWLVFSGAVWSTLVVDGLFVWGSFASR